MHLTQCPRLQMPIMICLNFECNFRRKQDRDQIITNSIIVMQLKTLKMKKEKVPNPEENLEEISKTS